MMPALLSYLVKVSISLAILYLFYFLVLRKMTSYLWIRVYLVLYSVLSLVIPFIDISAWTGLNRVDSVRFVYQFPALLSSKHVAISTSTHSLLNYQNIVLYIFLAGGLVMLFRLLVQLLSIYKLKAKATSFCSVPVKIYHLDEDILPFSFGKSIFINRHQHSEEEFQDILDHELVHIRQYHSIDVLFAEMICIVNWFNPFAWLIKRAIKQNLEFIADAQVVRSGADKKRYQYHLLKVMGYAPLAIVSHFNFPALKTRIIMMNKRQTGKVHLLKFLFIVPLLGLSLLAFRSAHVNKDKINENSKSISTGEESFRLNELTYFIKNHDVATLIKSVQDKSLLQPGKMLSLSLLQNESARLKSLLREHGYTPVTDQTITFLMDSSLTNKSFSIRILVNIPESVSATSETNKILPSVEPGTIMHSNTGDGAEVIKVNKTSGTFNNSSDIAIEMRQRGIQFESTDND